MLRSYFRKKYLIIFPLLLFINHLWLYLTSDVGTLSTLHADDAYYYHVIAQNIIEKHIISFDSIHLTNGFHPLWAIVLTIVWMLPLNEILYLRVTGVLSSLFIFTSLVITVKYLNRLCPPVVSIIALGPLLFWNIYNIRSVMEIVLIIPLGISAIFLVNKRPVWDLTDPEVTDRYLLLLGGTLALLQLARLDGVIFTVLFSIGVVICNRDNISKVTLRRFSLLIVPVALSGVGYLMTSYAIFGRVTPISGEAKSVALPSIWTRITNIPGEFVSPSGLGQLMHHGAVTLCLLYLIVWLVPRWRRKLREYPMDTVSLIVALFYLIQFTYLRITWDFRTWYYYPSVFVAVTIIPLAGLVTNDILSRIAPKRQELIFRRITVVVGMILLLITSSLLPLATTSTAGVSGDFRYNNYRAATEAKTELPQNATLAMGDTAGSFSYFVDRPTIQIEGITNNGEYIKILKKGGLHEYLCRNSVDYVVAREWPTNPDILATHNMRWTQNIHYSINEKQIVYSYPTEYSDIGSDRIVIASVDC